MDERTDRPLDIVVLGLSITSSWGNGHATTYRALLRALRERGHQITFLERDVPWYAAHRDLPEPTFATVHLYRDLGELEVQHAERVKAADLVIVGSYVPDGVTVGHWVIDKAEGVRAFYDIDTPVTLEKLGRKDYEYLAPELIGAYDLYLSFTGGPTLERLEREFRAPMARALYCAVDPDAYHPESRIPVRWLLGYLGTHSDDRQPRVDSLLIEPARALSDQRFIVAGPGYPDFIDWPPNVERTQHVPPPEHRAFYNAQRFTLNVTRDSMIEAGWAPSVRIFEAGACGSAIISDVWPGLDELLEPGREILLAEGTEDALRYLRDTPESEARAIGERARRRVLGAHTAAHRAVELEHYWREAQRRRT